MTNTAITCERGVVIKWLDDLPSGHVSTEVYDAIVLNYRQYNPQLSGWGLSIEEAVQDLNRRLNQLSIRSLEIDYLSGVDYRQGAGIWLAVYQATPKELVSKNRYLVDLFKLRREQNLFTDDIHELMLNRMVLGGVPQKEAFFQVERTTRGFAALWCRESSTLVDPNDLFHLMFEGDELVRSAVKRTRRSPGMFSLWESIIIVRMHDIIITGLCAFHGRRQDKEVFIPAYRVVEILDTWVVGDLIELRWSSLPSDFQRLLPFRTT